MNSRLHALADAGIDLAGVFEQLENEGVDEFINSRTSWNNPCWTLKCSLGGLESC